MSEIRVKSTGTIKLFESDNTSSVTIASPSSLSANRTITIPDADVNLTNIATNTAKTSNATHSGEVTGATALTIADNIVDEANLKVSNTPTNGYALTAQSGNTGGMTWAEMSSGGITGADQWRTNSNVSGDINPLTNVERNDTGGFAGIGSAMTQSSGIFTFPSTGIWLIRFDALFFGNADSRFNNGAIMKTTNNSSYAEGAYNSCLIQQTNSDNAYGTVTSSFMFDVTSTSTHKVKFYIDVDDNNTSLQGQTGVNNTTFTFLKLGDT